MSVRKKFISGIGWQSANVVTQVILQMIFIAVMARELSTEDFGVMGISLAVVGFIEIFSQIGIGPALIQRKDLVQGQITGAFFISLILGVGFLLLLLAMAPVIANAYDYPPLTPILQVIGISFVISAISIVPKSLIIKEMQFKKLFFAALVGMGLGNLGVGIIMAKTGYGVWAYVFALLAANVIMSIMYWFQKRVRITEFGNWSGVKGMIAYGGGSTIFNMLNYLATKADILIVGKYSNLNSDVNTEAGKWSSTGLYDRSVWLMGLPITVLGKMSDSVLFSGMSMLQDQQSKLQRTYLSGMYLISVIIFPACVFMQFYTSEIVMFFLGEKYLPAVPTIKILFLGVALRSLIKLGDAVVRALNSLLRASIIKGIFLALICVGAYTGLQYGLEGVATAVVIAIVVQLIMMSWLSQRLIGLDLGRVLKKMIPALAISIVTTAGCLGGMAINSLFEPHFMVSLLVGIGSCLTLLLASAFFTPWIFGKGDDNVLLTLTNRFGHLPILRSIAKKLRK